MVEKRRRLEAKQIVPLALLGIAVVGLSLFCNPSKVEEFLSDQIKDMFRHLDNWNEGVEVNKILNSIPDGKEREVAGLINGAINVNHRRIEKGQVKPHLVMLDALRAAGNIYSSGRRIR